MGDADQGRDWTDMIRAADSDCPSPAVVDTAHGVAGSGGSLPQKMSGPGGRFAVKLVNNPQGARVLFNEQVAGRIASHLRLPCPEVAIVDISADAALGVSINGTPGQAGPAHGSTWLDEVDAVGQTIDAIIDRGDNRVRYTQLMVLFTVIGQHDPQFVVESAPPNRLFSVDHGHTFSNAVWTADYLDVQGPPTELFRVGGQAHDPAALTGLLEPLRGISDRDLARFVRCTPGTWGVLLADRVAAVGYLRRRLDAVIALLEAGSHSDAA